MAEVVVGGAGVRRSRLAAADTLPMTSGGVRQVLVEALVMVVAHHRQMLSGGGGAGAAGGGPTSTNRRG